MMQGFFPANPVLKRIRAIKVLGGSLQRFYGVPVSPVLMRMPVVPNLPLDITDEDEACLLTLIREEKLRADLKPSAYSRALRYFKAHAKAQNACSAINKTLEGSETDKNIATSSSPMAEEGTEDDSLKLKLPTWLTPKDLTAIPDYFTSVKHLSFRLAKHGGRNISGQIRVRHRGGGFARRLRMLDMSRSVTDPERIIRIEYDPNRSGRIALLQNLRTKELNYILAPNGVEVGQIITNDGRGNVGNSMMLQEIPDGTQIYNIEVFPRSGGRIVRAAGTEATVVRKVFDKEAPILRVQNRKHGLVMSQRARRKMGLLKKSKKKEDSASETVAEGDQEKAPGKQSSQI
jgi:ribosomal protein L2